MKINKKQPTPYEIRLLRFRMHFILNFSLAPGHTTVKPSKPSVLHDCIHLIWTIEGLSTATHAIFDFEGAQNLSGDK
jgi:hypothetical protein